MTEAEKQVWSDINKIMLERFTKDLLSFIWSMFLHDEEI